MVELLAATDPFAAVLGCLWLFAAGLFPLGLMLGSPCSPCCCPACDSDTITVTISGLSEEPEIIPALVLAFDSDFGTGAAGRVTASGTPGPITGLELTSGGSGYAGLARIEPELTATGPDGTGAAFTLTYSESLWSNGRKVWSVSSIALADGGSGYPGSGSLSFSLGTNDTELTAAQATFQSAREAPAISLSVAGTGTGAQLTATLTYYDGSEVSFVEGDMWYVSGVTIDDGGSGYTAGDAVTVTIDDGESAGYPFDMTVTVDGNGTITGVVVGDNPYSVPWWNRGAYWASTGVIESVTLQLPGYYYGTDPDAADVAEVSVSVLPAPLCPLPSIGAGASFSVTIDDSTASETFGQITAVAIVDGGDDYLAEIVRYADCCGYKFNAKPFVLRRSGSSACTYSGSVCDNDCGAELEVGFYESGGYFVLTDAEGSSCNQPLITTEDSGEEKCSLSLTNETGILIQVERGGEYVEDALEGCSACCRRSGPVPDEIEAEISQSNTLSDGFSWAIGDENWSEPTPVVMARMTAEQIADTGAYRAFGGCDALYWINLGGWDYVVGMAPCRNPCDENCDGCDLCEPMAYVRSACGPGTSFNQDWGFSAPCSGCSSTARCYPPAGAELIVATSVSGLGLACAAIKIATV